MCCVDYFSVSFFLLFFLSLSELCAVKYYQVSVLEQCFSVVFNCVVSRHRMLVAQI